MKRLRHRWAKPDRPTPHKTERECLRPECGIIKITRHEGDAHWTEFYRDPGDGVPEPIATDKTPPCEGVAG